MKLHITGEFLAGASDAPLAPAALHDLGERLMVELLKLELVNEDVADPSTSTEADRGMVIVEFDVRADGQAEAVATFNTIVRTAVHAVGVHTPDWDEFPANDQQTTFTFGRTELAPA